MREVRLGLWSMNIAKPTSCNDLEQLVYVGILYFDALI